MSGLTRHRRALIVLAGLACLVLVALAAAWLALFRDTVQPASVDDALAAYRAQAEAGGTRIPPGVYVYATDGNESIDVLGGTTHAYPARSTITVTRADCGTALRWDVLRGRSTTWTQCDASDGGETLARVDETHRFFGRTERTDYTCTDTLARPVRAKPGTTWTVACDTAKGIVERGTGTVVAQTQLPVGDGTVPVARLRFETTFSGATRGSTTREMWVERETGLPVRVVLRSTTVNRSLLGDVTYRERVRLDLVSLTPRR
jgi:hypothetical protein